MIDYDTYKRKVADHIVAPEVAIKGHHIVSTKSVSERTYCVKPVTRCIAHHLLPGNSSISPTGVVCGRPHKYVWLLVDHGYASRLDGVS